jgi:clan AA aspartic protease (TIGR02281 family)
MKKTLLILSLLLIHNLLLSQTEIKMKSENGVSVIPCKVNGLKLNFIFDTGASEVSISLTEALFMLKNEYLDTIDIIGTLKYQDATGKISEGVTINLKEIEIGGLKLYNVKATIIKNGKAPLLLGQSAISKLGKIEIDLTTNTLTILKGEQNIVDTVLVLKNSTLTENDYKEAIRLKNDENDYKGIIADCNKILQIDPQSSYAYRVRGYAKAGLENYEDAILDYDKAIEIDSTDEVTYCNRGISKRLNGVHVKTGADRFFQSPKDSGMSKTELNIYQSALKDFNKSIAIDPKYDYAYSERATLYNTLKKYSLAIADYNIAIQLDNSYSAYYIDRGNIKQKLEDYKGAIADYNQAMYLDSSDYIPYLNRGNAKVRLKNYLSAINDYNKAIQLNPQEANIFYGRGQAKENISDFYGAINDYKKAKELDSTDIRSVMNIIFLEQKMKKDEWIEVATSQEKKFFIKSENLSEESGVIKFWWKAELKNKIITTNGKRITYANVKQLTLSASNCDSKLIKFYTTIFYNSKGNVIQSLNEESDWKNIIPETVMDAIFKKACELLN